MSELYDRGMKIRCEVLGDEFGATIPGDQPAKRRNWRKRALRQPSTWITGGGRRQN